MLRIFSRIIFKEIWNGTEKKKENLEKIQNLKDQAIHYLYQAQQILKKYFSLDSPHFVRIQLKLKNTE